MRGKLAVKNTVLSMLSILVAIIIGLVVPRFILSYFGSETNGLISSINQFLNYITILESGVGAVVVANLYKPFAQNDISSVSKVISKSRSFFLKLVIVYLIYAILLSILYPIFINTSFNSIYVTLMVLVLGITLFVQYCFTINYSLILQAVQKYYIASITSMILQIANAVITIVMIVLGVDILIVKFVSALVFMINPIVLRHYVKKMYPDIKLNVKSDYVIPQKKDTLVHNLTYVIHCNTDVILITMFLNVTSVSIYAVYNMVISSIRRLMESFSNGTQAAFGDMLARNEIQTLKHRFLFFEQIIIVITSIVFTITGSMLLPFVSIYTKGISDANYCQPLFAYLLVAAEAVYIYRLPYHTLVKAAALFKETKLSAIIEALLNIVVSIVLLNFWGLVGVAIGTLVSMLYRTIYYIFFFSKHIIMINPVKSLAKIGLNTLVCIAIVFATQNLIIQVATNVVLWVVCACGIAAVSGVVIVGVNYIFFRSETKQIISFATSKFRKKNRG